MEITYSFIIPVYNRPIEIKELLESMRQLKFDRPFEVVIVEDGSTDPAKDIVDDFSEELNISYFMKPNSGPGDSRNYGMQRAKGNYFLILDSDVILPPYYLMEIDNALKEKFVHCFGGPDAAHGDFSSIQKAINYSMTSFLTTGGLRGGKRSIGKFQPRSFNMGLSKEAFLVSEGFGRIHPGEDPDLALRLIAKGYDTCLFSNAYVYHKRRIDWEKFYHQVYKFGMVRPILNEWHPESKRLTFWFPSIFMAGLILGILLAFFGIPYLLYLYGLYFLAIFIHSLVLNYNVVIAVYSVWATIVQFLGYGFGFCRSSYYLRILKEAPEKRFPKLFFKDAKKTEDLNQNAV